MVSINSGMSSMTLVSVAASLGFLLALGSQGVDFAWVGALLLGGLVAAPIAAWLVRRTRDGRAETGRTTVREPARDKGYDALAAAHSRALGRMSQDIADAVRTLGRAAP